MFQVPLFAISVLLASFPVHTELVCALIVNTVPFLMSQVCQHALLARLVGMGLGRVCKHALLVLSALIVHTVVPLIASCVKKEHTEAPKGCLHAHLVLLVPFKLWKEAATVRVVL
jgi:hypothetical protein